MSSIKNYATLRNLLHDMEDDLGFGDLSDTDKRVIATLVLLCTEPGANVHLDDIRTHSLIASVPAPSLYRSFQMLIKKGLINKVGSARSGLYKVALD